MPRDQVAQVVHSRVLMVAQIQILTRIFGLDGNEVRFC